MAEIKYTIKLPPVSKKNSQQILTNRKTGKPFIMPSAKYREYEKSAAWYLTPRPSVPVECALNVKSIFYMPTRRRVDLVNLLEAVDDLLVNAGIVADDHCRIIAAHDGSRVRWDKDNPRTEITITKLPPEDGQMSFGEE